MFELRIANKARKEIKNLQQKHQIIILEALQDIAADPYLGKPLTRELSSKFSYRIGIFRIIYKINQRDNIVVILSAGHRANVYN
jgi:Cytotoxic translational repressor of toxin-antitoxin stability system